ncbi:MAG: adenylyl-sulfate kinase [Clostridia bacterium]|nr:adenylyl-sulfate kinase [Clostridia bacterium]
MSNINNHIEYINEMALSSPEEFIKKSEARYENIINDIAEKIIADDGREIVMLAGPSSAGKTTTAAKLCKKLNENGVKTYVLSLDDFYLNRDDIPYLPDGTQDYETVYALDLPCFEEKVNALLRGETVKNPIFDFTTGKRSSSEFNEITLGESDIVIIEGLHALNPIITEKIQGKLLKIYINVSSRIYDEKGNIILNKRNMRFVRRMVRDYKFRNSTVQNTYKLWKNVTMGEDKYLFPYRHLADIKINTIHLYEACVLKKQALEMLENSEISDEYKNDINKITKSLKKFENIDESLVPEDSLLREFLGK